MGTVAISIPDRLREEIDRLARQEGCSRSEIVREALRDLLFRKQFRRLRQRMMAQAHRERVFTDEDVFERVS